MSWEIPGAAPALADDAVHVWLIPLEPAVEVDAMRAVLSPDELERADRFHFERHRMRFTAARAALRRILSLYSDHAPETLRFVYGEHGKPALHPTQAATGLQFNLSHSHTLGLAGVTRAGEIGVDIERVRANHDVERTIPRFFSAKENAAFDRLSREQRHATFFRVWCRKEAFLKARGHGFFHSTRRFSVSVGPEEPTRLIEVEGESAEHARWRLSDLDPPAGYRAALVTEGDLDLGGTFRFEF